jgi:hypothetical protein
MRYGTGCVAWVYVIPYTSIIEQTADVFRAALDTKDPHTARAEPVHSSIDREALGVRSRRHARGWPHAWMAPKCAGKAPAGNL